MNTEIVKISDVVRQKAVIARAAGLLRQGQTVVFPTETVYGIGALGMDRRAVEALYAVKQRPLDKAFSLQVADIGMAGQLAAYIPEHAARLMERFCPGPLTIILPKAVSVPYEVTGGRDTVGVRIPGHPVALALLRAVGQPLAVPSANISGHVSPLSAASVYADMAGRVPLILDGGDCRIGVESTIVDCTRREIRLLRHGAVSEEAIRQALRE